MSEALPIQVEAAATLTRNLRTLAKKYPNIFQSTPARVGTRHQ